MKIAVIPGDGIGPEVTAQGLRVLKTCIPDLNYQIFDFGANRYLQSHTILTDDDLTQLQNFDAILLGAIGDPRVPSGILERGFLLRLRFAFDHHINLRPSYSYPGVPIPIDASCDLVVVREGTEGPYVGNGGVIREGTPHEVATEVSINTRFGVSRVVAEGFLRASKRRKKLTLVHKTNVLTFSGSLWERTVAETALKYPDVTVDYCHVDAATIYLVTQPQRFDVIVTDNLFGDILTDLAAAVSGGIGLAASANIDSSRNYPAMFEPVHGSAPDIAGKNIADPTAAILSVALLLEHLNWEEQACRIRRAVAAELENREKEDPSNLTTDKITERILNFLP